MRSLPLDKIKNDLPKLEPHPFSALFPPMQDDDFEKLRADIIANGLQQPIVIYQNAILDGNNRHRACMLGARLPKYVEFEGTDSQAKERAIERSRSPVPRLNGPVEPLPQEELKRPMSRYRRF